ncbi:MAG: PilZ domain-containing protein [Candidatus Omnitrophica bacterium]|nr:PilZ domain-containing protein [Candidatus Omnitrophota bacterium]
MKKERRQWERIDSLVTVKYISTRGRINGYALTKDLSGGGIGMPSDGKIPAGTELNLTISLQEDGQRFIPTTAKVVWSRRNFEHWKPRYSLGLKFLDIDSSDKDRLLQYIKTHRWIKSDFERALEEDKVPVLGKRGEF